MPNVTRTIPMLAVRDVGATLAYYRDKLGFTISGQMGDPVNYGIVRRDEAEIHFLFSHHPSATSFPPGGNIDDGKGGIYIEVSDVDSIAGELNERSHQSLMPEDREYGMRDFRILDLNGYLIVFGTKMPGK